MTIKHPEDYMYMEKCVLCIISSIFNIFVLFYHCTHAPHPKYLILPQRRFVIYIHILSGVLEFLTCWIAFCTGSERIATIAAIIAIVAHVPSAYYQTSIAFGAKAIMVAGYLFAINIHLFCALHLFFNPSSSYWLLNMFLVHNIYVWCRVLYAFFEFLGLFKDSLYTNSVVIASLILIPAVLGVSANMLFLGYVVSSILLYLIIVRPNKIDRAYYVGERTRNLLVNKDVHSNWLKENARLVRMNKDNELSDQQQAKLVFDLLDEDKNGYIDGEEINRLLKEWQTAENFRNRFFRWTKDGQISYENFYKNIWRLGETSIGHFQEGQNKEGKARARFIFDCLDNDSNGYLDSIEIQKLLIQWGLPDNEVDAYLANDDDKQFSFDEFYHNLKPVWDFAYENMTLKDTDEVLKPIHDHSS
ncbi:unnamed protein product [Adineta steineri]|uniref:EF-hand domain-containing protein n=1 Tax=Adineta steineri TaxID=433720 RepID=A0A819TPN3_9BILA|nr:unnamed protein product [Adineta steineri]